MRVIRRRSIEFSLFFCDFATTDVIRLYATPYEYNKASSSDVAPF